MKKVIFLSVLLTSYFVTSQVNNSNEKLIAQFYNADVKRFTINAGKVELQFKLAEDNPTNWYLKDEPDIRSAKKVKMYYLDIGLTNTSSFLNINDFDFKSVGYKAGVTFQNSFNKIYIDDVSNELRVNKLTTYIYSGEIRLDRFMNYDPRTNTIENKLPATIDFNFGINRYLFNTKYFKGGTLIPNLYAQVTPLGYNGGSLQNYLLNEGLNNNSQITFTSRSSFDGKYGVVENNSQASFVSFSSPFIFDRKVLNTFYFAPIPHLSWQTSTNDRPKYNVGIAFGFLNKPIRGKIEIEEEGSGDDKKTYAYHKFNVPSFLSFGVDWDYQGGNGSQPKYFISGSFTLD